MNTKPWLVTPVSQSELESMCKSAFGNGMNLVYSAQVDGVQFNTCYHVRITNPELEAILRIAPPDGRPLFSYERTMMLAEPHIYDMIRTAGVPMPEILALDASRTASTRPFMFVKFINSVRLNDPSIPQSAQPQLQKELGRYTAMIHGITGSQFGWPEADGGIRGDTSWASVFIGLMGEICARSADAGVISTDESFRIVGILKGNRTVFDMIREPRLVHNDIWAPNVMVHERNGEWRIAVILDADRAMFADREMEFAIWDRDDAEDSFMQGYAMPLDESPEGEFRRLFYKLYLYMFCAWAYRVQIWKPDEYESCARTMRILMDEAIR
ncbi:MAG: phosphotransferase family protein [Armatimonadota bacterium]